MSMPARADVDDATREALAGLALGDPELLLDGLELRAEMQQNSGLDPQQGALTDDEFTAAKARLLGG